MRLQKGFAPIIIFLVLALAGVGFYFVARTDFPKKIDSLLFLKETTTPLATSLAAPSPTSTPTVGKLPTPKSTKTSTPTSKPAATTSTSSSCNYNLSSSTGSVKIVIQTQTGSLTTSFYGNLKASSGCKVLDGRSTDTRRVYGSLSTKEIIFNSVPPGNYSVQAYVAGSWTGSQNVNVSAGQLATVTYSVTGDSPPATPTPAPKPICTTPVPMQWSPLTVTLYIGYTGGGSSSNLTNIEWDLTGDGSWDATVAFGNPYSYVYPSPGSYTVRGRIQNSSGVYSDPCQATIVVN